MYFDRLHEVLQIETILNVLYFIMELIFRLDNEYLTKIS